MQRFDAEAEHPERVQLKWLTLFRVAMVTVLLGATIAFNLQDVTHLSDRLYVYLYRVCTATYLVSFGYAVLLRVSRTRRALQIQTYVQLGGDVLFAAAMVLVTGGTASAFTFFFSLVIIAAAILVHRPGALFTATLSTAILVLIGLVEVGILPGHEMLLRHQPGFLGIGARLGSPTEFVDQGYRVIYNLAVNGLAFYAVALLASWLSEQLRRSAELAATTAERLRELRTLYRHIVGSMPTMWR